ncbi:MAG TPA: asparagine synthase-related protein, partial [Burkholderiaceae bacterium]
MQAQLTARVDLQQAARFAGQSNPLQALAWAAPQRAEAEGLCCVLMGRPILTPAGADPAAQLLQLWRSHGEAMLAQVQGAFAFVIFDASAGCVFAAVDRFARETLCWSQQGQAVAFSDRADSVLNLSGADKTLRLQSIHDFVLQHAISAPHTIFENVQRLPAGHSLLFKNGELRVKPYWQPRFDEQARPDLAEAKTRFLDLVRADVAHEAAGPGVTGAFLSGGTDSSTVAGLLCQVTGKPAKSYSIGFEAEGYDEMAYARIAARHFGCEHHEYYLTIADMRESLVAVAQAHDQPFGNSSALPAYYCAKYAKNDGCTKLLAGDGGDELFGGNTRYASQKFFDYYQAWPAWLRNSLEPHCGVDSRLRAIPGVRQ